MATRVSPGRWKLANGTIVNSATDPDKTSATKPGQAPKAPGKGKATGPQTNAQIAKGTNFSNPNSVAKGQAGINQNVYNQNQMGGTPNQNGPFGSSTITYDPVTGQPTQNTQMSGPNAGLYGAEVGADTMGANLAQQYIQGAPGQAYNSNNAQIGLPQGDAEAQKKVVDATYAQLTEGFEDKKKADYAAKQQELADRGIPVGSAQFNDQMKQHENQYAKMYADAKNQAVTTGYNQFNTQYTNQIAGNQAAVGNLQSNYNMPANLAQQYLGIGQGYQTPQAPQYNAPTMPGVDLGNIYGTNAQYSIAKQQLNKKAGGGSGGGGQKAPAPSYPSLNGSVG